MVCLVGIVIIRMDLLIEILFLDLAGLLLYLVLFFFVILFGIL